MAWSIDALAPEAHEHYLALGRRHTAHQVLAQANKALAACISWIGLVDMMASREMP